MRDSRGPLILLAIVVVVAVVGWLATRPRPTPVPVAPEDTGPIRFDSNDFPLASPDLRVLEPEVHGAIYPTFISWGVTMVCGEPEGCVGKIAVELAVNTGSGPQNVDIVSRVDVPNGGQLLFEGLQNQAFRVRGIDRLTIEVRDRESPAAYQGLVID